MLPVFLEMFNFLGDFAASAAHEGEDGVAERGEFLMRCARQRWRALRGRQMSVNHRQATRTTNLLERHFLEERPA